MCRISRNWPILVQNPVRKSTSYLFIGLILLVSVSRRITNSQINRITSPASFLPLTQLGTLCVQIDRKWPTPTYISIFREIRSSGLTNIAPDVFYDLCKSGRRSLDRLYVITVISAVRFAFDAWL